jgi:uncharacterized protein YbdZ (MbtH family)
MKNQISANQYATVQNTFGVPSKWTTNCTTQVAAPTEQRKSLTYDFIEDSWTEL